MQKIIVVDTNVLIGALIGKKYSANRTLIESCLLKRFIPLINNSLFLEYEDVFARPEIIIQSPYSKTESEELFYAFLAICQWTKIYYSWRPNLRDEKDNYLVELAIAGNADFIVTNNIKDFQHRDCISRGKHADTRMSFVGIPRGQNSELKFPQIKAVSPKEII